MRLNQPHDRMPPLRVPILTKMVVSASVASVLYALLLETTSEQQRAAAVHHSHVHRVHHVRGGADDVSGLLIAALTASAHAIGRGSEGACWLYVRCGALAADREPMAQPAASQLLWS